MRKRGGLKSPVRENRTPGSVRGPSGNRRSYRDGPAPGEAMPRRSVVGVVAEWERYAPSAHTLNPAAYLRRGGEQLATTDVRTEDIRNVR